MVELRKRKPAAEPAPPPPTKKKSSNPIKNAVDKAKSAFKGEASTNGSATSQKIAVGDTITLDGFGGEIETNDGVKTNLKKLVEASEAGVVLFTYPKASTPGCTTQACLFRDAYTHLTSTGLSIFGLSTDSPKANTTFREKQSLPYPLLCDPSATLISAIGFKKPPRGTTRGVFVIDKSGKILAAEPGGPQATVDVVASLIKQGKIGATSDPTGSADAVKETAVEAPEVEKQDTLPTVAATEEPSTITTPNAAVEETKQETSSDTAMLEPPQMDEAPLVHTPSHSEKDAAITASDVADTAAKLEGNDAREGPTANGSGDATTDGASSLVAAPEEKVAS